METVDCARTTESFMAEAHTNQNVEESSYGLGHLICRCLVHLKKIIRRDGISGPTNHK